MDLTVSGSPGVLLLLYLAVCLSTHFVTSQMMGAFDVAIKEISELEDVGTGDIRFKKAKIVKKGRSETNMVTTMSLKRPLDKEIGIRATLSIWGNGGWRPNFLTHSFKSICQYLDEFSPAFGKELFNQCGVENCPVPEGEYNLDIALSKFNLKMASFPFGKFKGDMLIIVMEHSGEESVLGGFSVVAEITPKKKKG